MTKLFNVGENCSVDKCAKDLVCQAIPLFIFFIVYWKLKKMPTLPFVLLSDFQVKRGDQRLCCYVVHSKIEFIVNKTTFTTNFIGR